MSRAADLVRSSLVWDNVWPLEPWAGNDWDKLPAFAASGWNVLSLTIAGKPFDETTVLRVADAYERATPWRRRRPDLTEAAA